MEFSLQKMLEDSFNIIRNFDEKRLVKAFLFLEELYGKTISNGLDNSGGVKTKDLNSILENYKLHLEASANSKNTIKDYCREINRFLNHLKENSTSFSIINSSYLNSYFYTQKIERKLSINSYSRLVIVIRSFLSYLYKEKIIKEPLALEFKTPRRIDKERESLADNEIHIILEYLKRTIS